MCPCMMNQFPSSLDRAKETVPGVILRSTLVVISRKDSEGCDREQITFPAFGDR